MEPAQQPQKQETNSQNLNNDSLILAELLDLGFDEALILESLKHTHNKEKAVEIILRYSELGTSADIADIVPAKVVNQVQNVPFKWPGFKYKMIFLVNSELKMGKGKICAQVGHACLFAYLQIHDQARFDQKKQQLLNGWENLGCAKIVVKVDSTKELQKFKSIIDKQGINNFLVQDAGRTQIKSGSKTVLGVGPVLSEIIDPITKDLKLL